MQDPELRQPSRADPIKASPVHPPLLAAAAERLPPQPSKTMPESMQSAGITRHCVVLVIA